MIMKQNKPLAMNFKRFYILAALLPAGLALCGQQVSDSKTLIKSFRAAARPVVEISNKYGDVHVTQSQLSLIHI